MKFVSLAVALLVSNVDAVSLQSKAKFSMPVTGKEIVADLVRAAKGVNIDRIISDPQENCW